MPLVLFDLDNTLLDREAAYARWARGFCDANGLPDDAHAWLVTDDDDGTDDARAALRAPSTTDT